MFIPRSWLLCRPSASCLYFMRTGEKAISARGFSTHRDFSYIDLHILTCPQATARLSRDLRHKLYQRLRNRERNKFNTTEASWCVVDDADACNLILFLLVGRWTSTKMRLILSYSTSGKVEVQLVERAWEGLCEWSLRDGWVIVTCEMCVFCLNLYLTGQYKARAAW